MRIQRSFFAFMFVAKRPFAPEFRHTLRATKMLIALAGTLSMVGCDMRADNQKATDSEVAETQETPVDVTTDPQEPNDNKAENLFDDGFYVDTQIDPAQLGDTAVTQEDAAGPNAERTINDQASSSLIEDLGFSGAETDQVEVEVDTQVEELYCLSQQSQTEELPAEICERISNRLSSVTLAACNAARLVPTGCNSVKGFPILLREFPPLADRIPKGRILIIGGTHGDELTSVSVSLRWIEKLNQHHSGLYHWHIAPLMNPDGVLKRAASRTNQNSVDLNRNMPSDDWSEKALKYWKQKGDKDPRKFPGEQPASEPETQWLIDEINTFKPDAIISVHAPYGVVDFDSLLLNTAPKSLGKLHLNLLGTYPGSLGNYAGINRNIPVITLELPHSWVMPTEKETTKIWEDIVSWLKTNINKDVASNDSQ